MRYLMEKLGRPADEMIQATLLRYIGNVEPSTIKDLVKYYLKLKMITDETANLVLSKLNECSKL